MRATAIATRGAVHEQGIRQRARRAGRPGRAGHLTPLREADPGYVGIDGSGDTETVEFGAGGRSCEEATERATATTADYGSEPRSSLARPGSRPDGRTGPRAVRGQADASWSQKGRPRPSRLGPQSHMTTAEQPGGATLPGRGPQIPAVPVRGCPDSPIGGPVPVARYQHPQAGLVASRASRPPGPDQERSQRAARIQGQDERYGNEEAPQHRPGSHRCGRGDRPCRLPGSLRLHPLHRRPGPRQTPAAQVIDRHDLQHLSRDRARPRLRSTGRGTWARVRWRATGSRRS